VADLMFFSLKTVGLADNNCINRYLSYLVTKNPRKLPSIVTGVVEILVVLEKNQAEIVLRECQLELLHLPGRHLVATLTGTTESQKPGDNIRKG
jgi:hypothetical protein